MKRISLLLLTLLLALALTGCQLAQEEEAVNEDRLAGLNMVLKTEWLPDEPNRSEPHEVDGEPFLILWKTNEQGELCISNQCSECFSGTHLAVKNTDEGDENTLIGALYIDQSRIPAGATLMLESVYQRADGSLYAINSGSNFGGMLAGLSHSRTERRTITDAQGNRRSVSTSIQLDVREGDPIASATLIALDEQNQVLSRYPLGEESDLSLSPNAAWALLVETLQDGATRRTAFNAPFDNTSFEVRLPGENGICRVKSYYISQPR